MFADFLGKSAYSTIARDFSTSLSVCQFVCYLSYLGDNKKCKIDVYRFWYSASIGAIAKILFYDLDLLLTVNNLKP